MKNNILHKILEQVKAVWEDLKSPAPYLPGTTCCSFGPTPFKPELRPEPIQVNNNFNINHKKRLY
ncbi:MAG: hypothetical protein R6W85_01935 [Gillisia sp.]